MLGCTFDGINLEEEYGMILKNVNNPFPEQKTITVEIPGADGIADLTDLFLPHRFTTRTLTLTFANIDGYAGRYPTQSFLANAFHGKKVKIVLLEEPEFYYIGRVSFDEWKITGNASAEIVATAICDPYKYEAASSLEDWEWDPFNFNNGIIREYGNITVYGSYTLVIPGRRKAVVPTITVSAPMTVTYQGTVYNLSAGDNILYQIALGAGENTLIFTGTGTVSVDYQGGSL